MKVRISWVLVLSVLGLLACGFVMDAQQSPVSQPALTDVSDPLVRLLATKGLISQDEARAVGSSGSAEDQRKRLALLLRTKGILSDAEVAAVLGPDRSTASASQPVLLASTAPMVAGLPPAAQRPQRALAEVPAGAGAPAPAPQPAAPPAVIAAIAPLRLLPVDPIKRQSVIPDIKIGSNIAMKPYGFFKTSAVYDSSSPGGNDMPLVGFLGDTGPTASPEFHLKARSFRIGSNFEWLDPSTKWVITGKVEGDFEGNFSRANNRNISTMRSNAFQVRTAWGRIDRIVSDKTSVYGLFGQDWTPFGSSTLPNMVETTGLGLGFGILYERTPLMKFGLTQTVGGSRNLKFQPEIAIVLPSYGNTPANISDQLAYGERQGVDSARPEVQGRFVTQWQLDKAPGVVPAQFIASFVQGSRKAIVTAANVPAAFKSAFPNGAQVDSSRYGYSIETQLPTRAVTFIAKYFNGKDLRYFFVNELYSNYNDTAGLTGVTTAASIDGSSNVAFGFQNGVPVVAPQRAVRTQGIMANLGFPLSRLFNASPTGRNAGWTAYLHYSYDYAYARDVRRFASGGRAKSDLAAGNIQYKMNSFVTFQFEESMYRTRTANNSATDTNGLPLLRGIPSRVWLDKRSEFATMFTF